METPSNTTPAPASEDVAIAPVLLDARLNFAQSQTSVTASSYDTRTFKLPPEIEEGIKAAVAAAIKPSSQGTDPSKWAVTKYVLRWVSLGLCIATLLLEVIAAVVQDPGFDTAYSIGWVSLFAFWDIFRLVQLRRRKGNEHASQLHVLIEGVISLGCLISVCVFGPLVNNVWGHWYIVRGNLFLAALIVLLGIHLTLFTRVCFENFKQRDGHGRTALELLPFSNRPRPQPPPVVIQYVHTCQECGSRVEPKPGEAINEALAARGDLQPQALSPAHFSQA